jgi:hypothetical protein
VDEVLYQVCREHPDHTDRRWTTAKVALIGRAYSAGLERRVSPPTGQQAIVVIADYCEVHGAEIDEIFRPLHPIEEPLSLGDLVTIVAVHGRLTELLVGVTTDGKSPRSFVSKYLHFHNPTVPIYDSYALAGAVHAVRWDASLIPFACPPGGDRVPDGYYQFCVRFWRLLEACRDAGREVTVKSLDGWLWSMPSAPRVMPAPYQPGDEHAQGYFDFGTGHPVQDMWRRPNRELVRAFDILMYGMTVDGYAYAHDVVGKDLDDMLDGLRARCSEGAMRTARFVDLRLLLFFTQRAWSHSGHSVSDDDEMLHALNAAVCDAWDREWSLQYERGQKGEVPSE